MKYKINIENLTKILDQNKVLDNINLEFKEGKIYGIIGRNGSGKSLLFKTICGFLTPTSGKVYINDIDIYQTKTFPPSNRKTKFHKFINWVWKLKIISRY